MNLPYEGFEYGASNQLPVAAGGLVLLPAICYDDAYGSSNLHMLPAANALVTVTNDGWFGHSTRPLPASADRPDALHRDRPVPDAGRQ